MPGGHYSVNELDGIADLHDIFPNKVADELNWCFFGTSGIHGSYDSLDDAVAHYRTSGAPVQITVLVVQPRMVRTYYGTITVYPDDIPWLQRLARTTMLGIIASQKDNL